MINQFEFDRPVCGECAADSLLRKTIESQGEPSVCSFCNKPAATISIYALADLVAPVYEQSVVTADPYPEFESDSDRVIYQPGGKAPEDILQELLGCDYDLAEVLRRALSQSSWHSVAEGAEDYYSNEQLNYRLEIPYSSKYDDAWADFDYFVKYRGRFFNHAAEGFLQLLLGPFISGDLNEGDAPIVEVGPTSAIRNIYRARQANEVAARKVIFASPRHELAAPSPRLRRQGRMNAAGIRAFYGSSDVETCVAETRIPVGGCAVVGKFEFLKSLRLLDFRKAETAGPSSDMSWFSPDFAEKHAYVDFIRRLHELMRIPVLPDAETFDYLPTQVLAEFLGHPPFSLDGVLLGSSLTPRSDPQESDTDSGVFNVVLFANAAIVEGSAYTNDFEIVSVYASSSADEQDDEYNGMDNNEIVNFTKGKPQALPIDPDSLELAKGQPSLRLLIDELQVVHVRGIKYDVAAREVKYLAELNEGRDY